MVSRHLRRLVVNDQELESDFKRIWLQDCHDCDSQVYVHGLHTTQTMLAVDNQPGLVYFLTSFHGQIGDTTIRRYMATLDCNDYGSRDSVLWLFKKEPPDTRDATLYRLTLDVVPRSGLKPLNVRPIQNLANGEHGT